jgi:hypothetical protein
MRHFTKYNDDDQLKDEIVKVCSTHGIDDKFIHSFIRKT